MMRGTTDENWASLSPALRAFLDGLADLLAESVVEEAVEEARLVSKKTLPVPERQAC